MFYARLSPFKKKWLKIQVNNEFRSNFAISN